MKDFTKYVLATIVGIVVTTIVVGILALMSIVGIVASGGSTKSVEKNSVLVLNLSGTVNEQGSDNVFGRITGNTVEQTGLNDILSAIKKAKTNDKIKGIYIEAGALVAGYSTLAEIRSALADFKKSGKWIVAYGDAYTQGTYYVSSVADSVFLNPSGEVDIHGLAVQSIYVKDLYDKLGIHFQIVKVGKYKSATEVYSEDHMSDANREQLTAFTTGMWTGICRDIAESRKISIDSINAYADQLSAFLPQEDIIKMHLVDGLLYSNEMKAKVKNMLGISEDDIIARLSVKDMRNVKEEKKKGEEIVVYYAEGQIVDTPATGIMNMGGPQIVGTEMCKDIDDLIEDDDVKAVVVRVNSPGGSAYASEQIWHRLTALKEKKPVVVSMGDYAASGGYYISCNASWIVAEPTTLTGSIGIFGIFPEASDLLRNKLSLHFDDVKTNEHADLWTSAYGLLSRPFTAEETDVLQGYVNRGYSLFRKRVADGRQQAVDQIEEIAGGHVWLGQDAIGIKLVDQLGSIDDAIAKAAELAGLDEYYTTEMPAEESWYSQLLDSDSSSDDYLAGQMKVLLGEWYLPFVAIKTATEQSPVQAMMPYLITIN